MIDQNLKLLRKEVQNCNFDHIDWAVNACRHSSVVWHSRPSYMRLSKKILRSAYKRVGCARLLPVMRESVTIKFHVRLFWNLPVCWSFKLNCCIGSDDQEIRNIEDGNRIVDCCSYQYRPIYSYMQGIYATLPKIS